MNDSSANRRARLMAETLHENWTEGPPAEFARRAAAHARRRRAVRRAALTVTGALALVALVAIFSGHRFIPATPPTGAPAPIASVAKIAPAYEIISDIEFEALMRDRPVLILPQQDGTRKIVVLTH